MAQQTSVDFLINELKSNLKIEWPLNIWLREKIAQAKQMEKEQQFRFFIAGQLSMEEGGKDFEQYYNETFTSTPQAENPSAIEIGQS